MKINDLLNILYNSYSYEFIYIGKPDISILCLLICSFPNISEQILAYYHFCNIIVTQTTLQRNILRYSGKNYLINNYRFIINITINLFITNILL